MSKEKGELVELDDEVKTDKDELVVVETPPAPAPAADRPARESLSGDDDDEGDGDDTPDSDPERERIRQQRRQEKLDRKVKRAEARRRDKLEMDFLRQRNDELERRISSVETHTVHTTAQNIEAQLKKARDDARLAEQVMAKAIAAGNGDDVTQALRFRDEANARAQTLAAAREEIANRVQQVRQPQQPAQTQVDPDTIAHAKKFLSENRWYDPNGQDQDSAIVLAIDGALVREGFRPQTEEYWEELRERAARVLPSRFAKANQQPDKPQRPARGGPQVGGGSTTGARPNEVYISPERKKALQEAGVWDDRVLRARFVKRYAEYDKATRA